MSIKPVGTATAPTQDAGGAGQSAPTGNAARRSDSSFSIHWGRTLSALIAVTGLLSAVVTGVISVASTLSWLVPVASVAVFLAAMVSLQISAAVRRRRKRRARVEAAMREAMNPDVDVLQRRYAAVAQQSSTAAQRGLFDALRADAAGQGGPDSLVKLDEDGLPDNAERLFSEADIQARTAIFDQTGPAQVEWQPREVPQPKYLAAEKAQRPEPMPEPAPQLPVPQPDTKLRQPAAPAVSGSPAEPGPAQQSMDLDEVLKRRRA